MFTCESGDRLTRTDGVDGGDCHKQCSVALSTTATYTVPAGGCAAYSIVGDSCLLSCTSDSGSTQLTATCQGVDDWNVVGSCPSGFPPPPTLFYQHAFFNASWTVYPDNTVRFELKSKAAGFVCIGFTAATGRAHIRMDTVCGTQDSSGHSIVTDGFSGESTLYYLTGSPIRDKASSRGLY
jgi:hypothetical protein